MMILFTKNIMSLRVRTLQHALSNESSSSSLQSEPGAALLELLPRQVLRKDVSHHILSGGMLHDDFALFNRLPYEVVPDVDVLGS